MSLLKLLIAECKAIFSNSAITLTVFGGVIFYSFLYPLPYAKQTPTEQYISVVNLDRNQVSYRLERMVDATPQVKIVERAYSLNEAKQQFIDGKVRGILVIPEHFYRDLLLGKSPVLSYSGDASYFLVYGTIAEGLAKAGATLGAQVKVTKLLAQGVPMELAQEQYSQVKMNLKPTFNPSMGYVNYVVPAVFVLILQQTLVMGMSLLGCSEKSKQGYWAKHPFYKVLATRCCIFVAIYYLLALYYFGFSFDFYHINQLSSPLLICTLLLPFLLTSCFIGNCLGALLVRKELVTLVVLVSSMPLIFSAGFIWPTQSIPQPIVFISQLFPSTPAIQGFLGINQIGADWTQIQSQWQQLWLQVIAWGGLAALLYQRQQKQINSVN